MRTIHMPKVNQKNRPFGLPKITLFVDIHPLYRAIFKNLNKVFKVINKSATLHRPWLTPYSNSFLQKLIFCIYLHHIHLIKPFYYEKNIIFS